MPSDVESPASENTPKKSSGRIFREEVDEGLGALDMELHRLSISAFSAGLEISLSLFLIALVMSAANGAFHELPSELLLATMYSFGFIVVIVGRSELFTEQTTLAILPWLAGKTTVSKVARVWGVVYVGNLLGTAVGAALIVFITPALGHVEPAVFGKIAVEVVDHPAWVILLSGVLAGWLMGLASWLVAAGRDTISQIVLIWLFTATIGFGHLHHSVLGTAEVLGGIFAGAGTTLVELGHSQLWATLGNALGGVVFVALLKYGHARPQENA
jgi:formate-nitrite transporter family protein